MIPKIIHFIYGLDENFAEIPFSLVHYLAIKSAQTINNPERINFFFRFEPEGEYWEKAKPYLHLVPIEPVTEIFSRSLVHAAHRADVLRLLILLKYGGIYLDIDTICVRSFDPLLNHSFVIGQQGSGFHLEGLCNAVMLGEKDSSFVKAWLNSYDSFRSCGQDLFWDEHSVKVPLQLAPFYTTSGDLHIEPFTSFHYPHYSIGIEKLFEGDCTFPDAYCHHLWERSTWERYLKDLTEKAIFEKDTYYNILARRYL